MNLRFNYDTAEAIASGWERRRAFVEEMATPVREWMVRALAAQPGETILELAAGAGDTGFEAAAAVGASGHLITTDVSPAMVEVARRRGNELGIDNAEYGVMDAEHIELGDGTVDGILCRWGYMLVNAAAAFAEAHRVLRRGGRLVLAVWSRPERNPYFALMNVTLIERGLVPRPQSGDQTPFNLADEERTTALLQAAGFDSARTEKVRVGFDFADVDDYMSVASDIAGPIALVLRGLSDSERTAVRAQLSAGFERYARGGRHVLPGLALCVAASYRASTSQRQTATAASRPGCRSRARS